MISLNQYITEFVVNKHIDTPKIFTPKDNTELFNYICKQLKNGITDLNNIDLTNITSLENLFSDVNECGYGKDLKNIDISKWDVSHITSMAGMFMFCKWFNSDISKWDVSNVKNFDSMFHSCIRFNQDITDWNVSNCENFKYMFFRCSKLNQDLAKWDISNAIHISHMFDDCKKLDKDFTQWKCPKKLRAMFCVFDDTLTAANKKNPEWYKNYK